MMKHSRKKYLKKQKIDDSLASFLRNQPAESNLGNIKFNELGQGIVLTETCGLGVTVMVINVHFLCAELCAKRSGNKRKIPAKTGV